MTRNTTTIAVALSLILVLPACGGGGGGTKKGKTATITGALKNGVGKKIAVGAKSKSGKTYQAKVDPKTDKFQLNLPKGEPFVMSANIDSATKVIHFPKSKDSATDLGEEIDTDELAKDAIDLGEMDLSEDEIVMGDEEGENSIYEFEDSDADGDVDWIDTDDDGDGILDAEDDFDDIDQIAEGDEGSWGDDESDWGGFYEADDLCGLDDASCETPEDWIDIDGEPPDDNPPDDNPPDDSEKCVAACGEQCGDDSECYLNCAQGCVK